MGFGTIQRLPGRIARSIVARTGDAFLSLKYLRLARQLRDRTKGISDRGALFDAVAAFPEFRAAQVRPEFLALLARLAERPPRTICEIGMATGGTAFLFARIAAPDAVFVTIDCIHHPARRAAVRRFATADQRIFCLQGDSHQPSTLEEARRLVGGSGFDFDHSYEGVRADFELFAPFVRPEGRIAFHDIVLDYKTRHGRDTGTYTGGVPRYWTEVRSRCPAAEEFVDDPEQDGFGIGFIPRADAILHR